MGNQTYSTEEPCLACGIITEGGNALHHVTTRGSGGGDDPWNLMPLCFQHHTQVHLWGMVKFSEKFKPVKLWLKENKWELHQKWRHPIEEKEDVSHSDHA
jgi:5-methylcytosine-specific restriction endonuclease McrA